MPNRLKLPIVVLLRARCVPAQAPAPDAVAKPGK